MSWQKRFRKGLLMLGITSVVVASVGCSIGTASPGNDRDTDGKTKVEILYLPHPPVKPILDDVNKELDKYKGKVHVYEYTFDSKEGDDLAKKRGITSHTPIVIFINGAEETKVDGKDVKFNSFPKGQGNAFVGDGGWTIDQLDGALTQAIKGDK